MDIFSAKFLLVAVVALIVLGPDRLPGALRTAGRLLGEFRRISAGLREEADHALDSTGLGGVVRDLQEPIREVRQTAVSWRNGASATPAGNAAAADGPDQPLATGMGRPST